MYGIRIIVCSISFFLAPVFAQDYDVHDILYRSLIGDNVKGNYMGKVYNDQPEILDDDLFLVNRAVVTYKYTPLNVDNGIFPWPSNSADIEVKFEVIGRYSGTTKKVLMSRIEETRHIKYLYYKKKFEGISVDEPQFVACSVFIDHVYNLQKEFNNDGVENYSNDHPNKIFYHKLNELIETLEADVDRPFCEEGFSLVVERTPRKTTKTERSK